MTTKARRTSFSTASKSLVSNDFFGLMTMSALTSAGGRDNRTASRSRRFMRLRSTAPPRARPTVNPTRSPRAGVAFMLAGSPSCLAMKKAVKDAEKWRRPCLYTRSKSEWRNKRRLRGNFVRAVCGFTLCCFPSGFDVPGTATVPFFQNRWCYTRGTRTGVSAPHGLLAEAWFH